uniref:Uncharacterized protein n=1 Tax=Pyricularia oryzae (strain P131) TaxID=1143193 RepID=L7JI76_PYRO1
MYWVPNKAVKNSRRDASSRYRAWSRTVLVGGDGIFPVHVNIKVLLRLGLRPQFSRNTSLRENDRSCKKLKCSICRKPQRVDLHAIRRAVSLFWTGPSGSVFIVP